MEKQFGNSKKTLVILLAVCFLVSLSATAVSAHEGYYRHGYHHHYDYDYDWYHHHHHHWWDYDYHHHHHHRY